MPSKLDSLSTPGLNEPHPPKIVQAHLVGCPLRGQTPAVLVYVEPDILERNSLKLRQFREDHRIVAEPKVHLAGVLETQVFVSRQIVGHRAELDDFLGQTPSACTERQH